MEVEHELGERPLEPGERAGEHDEPRPGHLRRPLEVHLAQPRADLEMLLGREVEFGPHADGAQDDVGAGVLPHRHVIGRQVGQAFEQLVEPGGQLPHPFLGFSLELFLGRYGADHPAHVLALGLGDADLLGQLVAPGLYFLGGGERLAALLVERDDARGCRPHAAGLEPGVEGRRIVADPFEIEHREPSS